MIADSARRKRPVQVSAREILDLLTPPAPLARRGRFRGQAEGAEGAAHLDGRGGRRDRPSEPHGHAAGCSRGFFPEDPAGLALHGAARGAPQRHGNDGRWVAVQYFLQAFTLRRIFSQQRQWSFTGGTCTRLRSGSNATSAALASFPVHRYCGRRPGNLVGKGAIGAGGARSGVGARLPSSWPSRKRMGRSVRKRGEQQSFEQSHFASQAVSAAVGDIVAAFDAREEDRVRGESTAGSGAVAWKSGRLAMAASVAKRRSAGADKGEHLVGAEVQAR